MIRSQIRRPHTEVPFHIDGYGLGWFTGHYRGTWPFVTHKATVTITISNDS